MTARSRWLVYPAALAIISFVVLGLLALISTKPTLYSHTSFSSGVEDRNGILLRLALADDDRYRLRTTLQDISPTAIDATLLYEDRYFRSHIGFNPVALLRAVWSSYIIRSRRIGGSTITMQLARLRFRLNTRTVGGKISQIARAVQLERHYSKNEILEAYLNLAPYGGNIEGIGAASLIYFDKPASRLSFPEALALAVIPQNPVERNPITPHGYKSMDAARNRLGTIWAEHNAVSAATQVKQAMTQLDLPLAVRSPRQLPYRAAHFSRTLLNSRQAIAGMNTSTLDWETQRLVEQRIHHYIDRRKSNGIANASALLLDYRTMEVMASVGSASFSDSEIQGQVDGTRSKRSPGSTLKPFVYGLAIDAGLIHPMSLLKDAPKRFAAYTPENFDRGFLGPVIAQDALIYSRNVPAIDLLSQVGYKRFHDFLVDSAVSNLQDASHYGLAMILGGNELTMTELTSLYAMLANEGQSQSIVSSLNQAKPDSNRQLLSAEASFLVLDMLRKNPRPGAVNLDTSKAKLPIAWKTGTSYAFRDAWTVGVFGPYVLAVWVGNFDGTGNPALVGREAAAPLYFEIADSLPVSARERLLTVAPSPKLNLARVDVCASTGDLPGKHCPQTTESWFVPGVSPIKVSKVHRAIRVDNQTGKRSCSFDSATTHEEIL